MHVFKDINYCEVIKKQHHFIFFTQHLLLFNSTMFFLIMNHLKNVTQQ